MGKCLVKYVGHVGSGKIMACCEIWKLFGVGEVCFGQLQICLLWSHLQVCQHH